MFLDALQAHLPPPGRGRPAAVLLVLALCVLALTPAATAQEVIDLFEDTNGDGPGKDLGGKAQEAKKPGEPAAAITIEGAGGVTLGGAVSDRSSGGGQLTLRVDRRGSTYLVKVKIQGKEAYLMFDTGASYVSLTPDFARQAGVLPPQGAPKTMLSTANGHTASSFGLIDRLDVGDRLHTQVSYLLCAGCPTSQYKGLPVVGLLGMNVLRRYRFDIDDARGEIHLTPNSHYNDQQWDIEPWLRVEFDRRVKQDAKRAEFRLTVQNLAPRRIRALGLRLICEDGKAGGRSSVQTLSIGARSKETISVIMDRCEVFPRPEVVSGRW